MRVCRDPISEFLWAHCDGGHRPRFSSFLRHPGPEIPGEPFESSWGLPEVPRRWHPQAHYRERLAGTHFFLLPYLYTTNYTIFVLKDETGVDTNILKNITAFIDTIFPFFSLTAAPLSESWWDVEELLLRHSFLPQRGVHPLLRRLRHQAVCSRWTTLLWPAWQLRRTVELASPSPPLHCFITTTPSSRFLHNQTLHPSPSSSLLTSLSCIVTLFCSHVDSGAWSCPHRITALNIVVVYVCVHHHSIHSPPILPLHLSSTATQFFFIWKCTNLLTSIFLKSCKVCH